MDNDQSHFKEKAGRRDTAAGYVWGKDSWIRRVAAPFAVPRIEGDRHD